MQNPLSIYFPNGNWTTIFILNTTHTWHHPKINALKLIFDFDFRYELKNKNFIAFMSASFDLRFLWDHTKRMYASKPFCPQSNKFIQWLLSCRLIRIAFPFAQCTPIQVITAHAVDGINGVPFKFRQRQKKPTVNNLVNKIIVFWLRQQQIIISELTPCNYDSFCTFLHF